MHNHGRFVYPLRGSISALVFLIILFTLDVWETYFPMFLYFTFSGISEKLKWVWQEEQKEQPRRFLKIIELHNNRSTYSCCSNPIGGHFPISSNMLREKGSKPSGENQSCYL